MIEVMPTVIEILTQDELVVEIRDTLMAEGFNQNTIIVYYIFTVSGGIVIPFFISIFTLFKLFDLGNWICKNIKLKDMSMFWNGIPTIETETYKRLNKKMNLVVKRKERKSLLPKSASVDI